MWAGKAGATQRRKSPLLRAILFLLHLAFESQTRSQESDSQGNRSQESWSRRVFLPAERSGFELLFPASTAVHVWARRRYRTALIAKSALLYDSARIRVAVRHFSEASTAPATESSAAQFLALTGTFSLQDDPFLQKSYCTAVLIWLRCRQYRSKCRHISLRSVSAEC